MSLGALFAWPAALPALLLVPLAWWGLRELDRARARRLVRLVGPRTRRLAAELSEDRRRVSRALWTGGLALALLAAAQPLLGVEVRRVEHRGVDLFVCLDVSRSMLAGDLQPSRLESAHGEIRALADRVRGDRVGLVAFAGEARLCVPLTRDMDTFAELAELTDPLSVERGGTDLGAALDAAREAFEERSGRHEAILLVTDGEDLEQRGLRAARACHEAGIAVHCAGFGSPRGSKIAVGSPSNESFLRDRAGEEVVSAMDPAGLRRIAEATGGSFADAQASPRPLVELYRTRVLPMARKSFSAEERRERKNRFQWPLLLALAFWILEFSRSDRVRP